MSWINFIATSKYARGTEGHIASDELEKVAKNLEAESYYCVFDLVKEQLKVEVDTGRTEIVNGKTRKIYSYHDQNSGVEGPLSFNQYSGLARPAFGLVQFDFDDPEDINNSYKDAKGFIEWLGIESGYHLAFSGSKGFHVALPFEYFGLEVSPELPKILHDLAASLVTYFKTLDVKVYNANRKFRILNTAHKKTGLYKTIIHKDMTVPEILEYAKRRREWPEDIDRTNLKGLEVLVHAIEESKLNHAYDKDKAGTQADTTRFESYDGKICIQRLITDRCEEGGRNNTAFIIAYDLFKTGKTKNYATEVLTKWAVDNELPLSEALPIVERAFSNSQYYNHGCQDSIKAAKCSAKCPLWKKLDPEKRPVPVDAPKTIYLEAGKKNKLPAAHFIENYLVQNVVTMDLSDLWYINGKLTDQAYLCDLIYCEALLRKRTVDPCSAQTIFAHLNIWREKEKERLFLDLRNHLKHGGEKSSELERWLKAVRPEADATDLAVMIHWIWQIKRKVYGLSVQAHLMPVFCGLTNTGKSVAVRRLISPLAAISSESDLKRIGDSREDFILIRSFIMFLDEMAKASSADFEILKYKITANTIEYRKLGSNATVKGSQNATFIGTSNYSVIDIIKDPTSARRYYELWVKGKCDWKTINEIDYLQIWRSVNEQDDEASHLKGHEDEIKKRQDIIRDRDSVEEWLEYDNLKPVDGVEKKEVKARELYDVYMRFMEFQERKRFAVSINKFGRLMSAHTERVKKEDSNFYLVRGSKPHSTASRVTEINF
jgi:hypothetical protein